MKYKIERKKNQVIYGIAGGWDNLDNLEKYRKFFLKQIKEQKRKISIMDDIIKNSYIESIRVLARNEVEKLRKKLIDFFEFDGFICQKIAELEEGEVIND